MLIESYDLDVETVPCEPGAEKFAATVQFKVDISPVMPYLNRVLRGAMYNPQAHTLSIKTAKRNIAYWPYKISIGDLSDRNEAAKIAQELVDELNDLWERRDEIEPDHTMHKRPGPMEVYKLLPRTNCRACGQPTCFIFAGKLVVGQVELKDCPELLKPQYSAQLAQLADLLMVEMPEGLTV